MQTFRTQQLTWAEDGAGELEVRETTFAVHEPRIALSTCYPHALSVYISSSYPSTPDTEIVGKERANARNTAAVSPTTRRNYGM